MRRRITGAGFRSRSRRGRTAWCLALLAALLNAFAPVFAYAIGQPLHELAGGHPGGGARAVLAHHASPLLDHAGMHMGPAAHAHAGHHDARHADPGEPSAPHCPYCLDFAAGAPLAASVPVIAAVQPGHPPLPLALPKLVAARPSLRLASSRGPPVAG
jgi:hypothetical protein